MADIAAARRAPPKASVLFGGKAVTTAAGFPPMQLVGVVASAAKRGNAPRVNQLVLHGQKKFTLANLCSLLETLSTNDEVKVVDLSAMALRPPAFSHIADFVAYSPQLTRLDLSDNDMPVNGAKVLGTALVNHPSLAFIVLERVNLGNEGLAGLLGPFVSDAAKLRPVTHLERVNISHNGISGEAASELIVGFVSQHESVGYVNVCGNFITSTALAELNGLRVVRGGTLTTPPPSSKGCRRHFDAPEVGTLPEGVAAQMAGRPPTSGQHTAAPGYRNELKFLVSVKDDITGTGGGATLERNDAATSARMFPSLTLLSNEYDGDMRGMGVL